jgi:hypothetical protein
MIQTKASAASASLRFEKTLVMKNQNQTPVAKTNWLAVGLFAVVLALLFWRSFLPDYVHFSNDGPLGQQNADWLKLPAAMTGMWVDLNDTGFSAGAFAPSITAALKWLLGPVGYAKFYAPVALFILGLGAWTFFRALKLTPLAAMLGALAAMLSSTFFAGACWGVAAVEIALGVGFFALALAVANTPETPWFVRWTRLALAGLCVGVNVMEAADVGALFSLFIAAFVFFKSLADEDGSIWKNAVRGVSRVAIVAMFAGFIAFQTILSLVGTSITGVAGTAQDAETKAQHWDFATQWSLPKKETLGLFVPGLFGYKMDTPNNMMPALQDAYRGGIYWGGVGRSPELDRYFDSGSQGVEPSGPGIMMRFGYAGYYCGILVVLVAFWAIAQSFRRQNSPFSGAQKKFIWFWTVIMVVSLLLAWGRFAPMFYGLLYQLPYFSTIRNPAKFSIFCAWTLAVLFAYGIHALSRRHLESAPIKSPQTKTAARKWDAFDRKWTFACTGVFGASIIGWLMFAGHKPEFVEYLKKVGYGDENFAQQIAAFSIGQAGWFIVLFAGAITLLTLIITGYFSGPRAKFGAMLLGAFLVFDLGRANLPFIIHWDYKQKYEVGSLNPVVELLRDKSYEHRVAYGVPNPLQTPSQFEAFEQLYRIEWMQHHFPYYNIQCLDIIQMPRTPEDLQAFLGTFQIRAMLDAAGRQVADPETYPLARRRWELTNTKYLLGPTGLVDLLNGQFDSQQHRFRVVQRFAIGLKPGVEQFHQRLEELTVAPNDNGDYALIEFTGALPRVKLYANWQVNTNDQANLKTLADLNFDPAKTVLISTPQKNLPALATNENSGTVEFKSYAPKKIEFATSTAAPAVLLLNDKYDASWRVTVDGRPAELLRCNFLMRGVYVPAGTHAVTFQFSLPNKPLYVTLAAIGVGILLGGFLFYSGRRNSVPAVQP